ncbi:hypothetical protein KC328_g91 [Hortaea werneckii]|nr:hypothetical protein KC328_g91 [Hortaea werneckii]
MPRFRGGPNGPGNMNGALGGGGRMNGKTGPDGPGSMNSTNGLPGKGGINGMNSTPGLPGIGRPHSGPPVPNLSTGISLPSNWRDFPIDKTAGKIDRRAVGGAVGGAAGQNGIEKDGDLLIIEKGSTDLVGQSAHAADGIDAGGRGDGGGGNLGGLQIN